jgi:hypothetical protein
MEGEEPHGGRVEGMEAAASASLVGDGKVLKVQE